LIGDVIVDIIGQLCHTYDVTIFKVVAFGNYKLDHIIYLCARFSSLRRTSCEKMSGSAFE